MEKSVEKPKIKNLKNTTANLNREISRLSQKNEILTAEKKILDEILDNLPGTFYIWDERPQLIRKNRKHEEITDSSHGFEAIENQLIALATTLLPS